MPETFFALRRFWKLHKKRFFAIIDRDIYFHQSDVPRYRCSGSAIRFVTLDQPKGRNTGITIILILQREINCEKRMICPISLPFLRFGISEYLMRKNVRVAMVLTLQRKKEKRRKENWTVKIGRVTKEVANSLISCRSTTPLFPTIHISFHLKQRPIKRKKNNRLFHVSNLLLFFRFCRRFSGSVEKDIQLLCDTKERREIDICGFSISFSRFKSSTLQLQNKQREEIFENEWQRYSPYSVILSSLLAGPLD